MQKVIIAQVEMPILGWDFIKTFRLSFDGNARGQYEIIDRRARVRQVLNVTYVPNGTPL